MSKPALIGMCGLPRSGKSTIVADLSKRLGAPIVRRDALRLALHGTRYNPEMEPMVKSLDLYMIKALFLAGHDIVICDETNFSRAARAHLRDKAWETIWFPVKTEPSVCIERAIATEQADLIPVITEMARRWEDFEPGDEFFLDITDLGALVTTKARQVEEPLVPILGSNLD